MRNTVSIACSIASALLVSSFASAATVVNGNFRHELTDAVFSTQINGDSNVYTDGVNFSADWVGKYTWYVRNNTSGNRGISSLIAPTVTGNNTNQATFTWNDNGPGPSGIARYDNTATITVTDGATAGTGMSHTRMTIKANANNASAQTYQLFMFFDGNVVGGGTGETISSTSANGNITGSFTDSGSGVINFAISGNPTIFQAGREGSSSTVAGTPLRNIAGTSSSVYATTNLSASSSYTDATFGGAIAAQWTFTLGPSDPAKTVDFLFAINQPIPEPTSLAGLAVAGLLTRRRR